MIAAALIAMAAAKPAEAAVALPKCTTTQVCPRIVRFAVPWSLVAKPSLIVLGASRPELGSLHWKIYNSTEAVATGLGEGILPGCPLPSYECTFTKRPVTVTFLHPAKGGAGKWYFTRMHVAGNVGALGIKPNWGITKQGIWG